MSKGQGIVFWRRHDSTLDFRVEGWGTIPESLSIRRCVETSSAPPIKVVRMNLADCTYMDSTFVGTLIFFKRSLTKSQGAFVLVQPSPECRQLLAKMGIAQIFNVCNEPSALDDVISGPWRELTCGQESPFSFEFKENVCNAHQELAEEEGSSQQFMGVAAMLQRELAKERQSLQSDSP